jgi:hypothetical protein
MRARCLPKAQPKLALILFECLRLSHILKIRMICNKEPPMLQREPFNESAWRRERGDPSLSDVYRSIKVAAAGTPWRRAAAFVGPGYLVAVGYMDPGNWATSLAGGSKFGYTLLVVALVSNIIAIVLQSLCARLAIASGRDLAQACRDAFPRPVAFALWLLAELAIIATDIAEVIGTAIGLNLLFGIPLEIGVIITALDVFLILYLQTLGFRYIEALIMTLLGVIAVCFGIQIALANPDWAAVIKGFAPTTEIVTNPEMLYIALGILGATVMPHNLYLHSGLVQTRAYGNSIEEKRSALKYATIDSTVALMFALLINASILILAAATFNAGGPVLRHQFDGDGHARRPDRDGRLPEHPAARLAAPADHADDRHHTGGRRDHLVRRQRHRAIADPQPGGAQPAAFLRRDPAGDVHGIQGEDGRTGHAGLADHHRLGDGRRDRGAESEAAVRFLHGLSCGASL